MKYKQRNQMGRKSGIFAAHVEIEGEGERETEFTSRHFDHQHHRRLFHLLIKHIYVGNASIHLVCFNVAAVGATFLFFSIFMLSLAVKLPKVCV